MKAKRAEFWLLKRVSNAIAQLEPHSLSAVVMGISPERRSEVLRHAREALQHLGWMEGYLGAAQLSDPASGLMPPDQHPRAPSHP